MNGGHKSILLVEDDPNDALFMKMALDSARVKNHLETVTDGKQAVAYLSGSAPYNDRKKYPFPYLMLLDLKLPHMMGLEVLKWVREQPQFDGLVVIVLTASPSPADVEAAYHLGANAYLVKPSSYDKLEVLAKSIRDFWLMQNQAASPAVQG
jgi:CheY-like chemotaxis protein